MPVCYVIRLERTLISINRIQSSSTQMFSPDGLQFLITEAADGCRVCSSLLNENAVTLIVVRIIKVWWYSHKGMLQSLSWTWFIQRCKVHQRLSRVNPVAVRHWGSSSVLRCFYQSSISTPFGVIVFLDPLLCLFPLVGYFFANGFKAIRLTRMTVNNTMPSASQSLSGQWANESPQSFAAAKPVWLRTRGESHRNAFCMTDSDALSNGHPQLLCFSVDTLFVSWITFSKRDFTSELYSYTDAGFTARLAMACCFGRRQLCFKHLKPAFSYSGVQCECEHVVCGVMHTTAQLRQAESYPMCQVLRSLSYSSAGCEDGVSRLLLLLGFFTLE